MSLYLFRPENQLEILESIIARKRKSDPRKGSAQKRELEVLASLAADVRARCEISRSNALGQLELALDRAQKSKSANGYETGAMISVAETLISKWPFVRQALEKFGEESAE